MSFAHVQVPVGHGTRSLAELIDGYSRSVQRHAAEQDRSVSDTRFWGAHDYVGCLHLRQIIATTVERLPDTQRDDASAALAPADELLWSITQDGERPLLERFAAEEHPNSWWWDRAPYRGPVREELDKFENASQANDE
jgi:hypothetical protein